MIDTISTDLKKNPASDQTSGFLAALEAILGSDCLSTDEESRRLYGADILGAIATPIAIASPSTIEQLVATVRACVKHRISVYPRGGGASYTHAHVPADDKSIVIDSAKLNRIIDINADNMTVTVEPGVTWKALDDALAEHDLRTPFWGPFSGLHSTIGGSLSQHAISFGSGLYDASNSIVNGLKVVTGAGDIIDTGPTASSFYRTYGPDLTGLFLGDSGAFGVKLSVTLRLIKRPRAFEGATFIYGEFKDMANAMMAVAKENVATEVLAIDPQLQKGQLGAVNTKDMAQAAVAIFKSSPNISAGVKALAKAALGARDMLNKPGYMVNYVAEGQSAAEAKAKMATLRNAASAGGVEIANTMALAMRAMPFRPFTPVVGPQGERWWPMHGVLPFSAVLDFHQDFTAFLEERQQEMTRHRVHIANMFLTVGSTGFVYEPTFYWQDTQHIVQKHFTPEEHRLAVPTYDENPQARAFTKKMKKEIVALMQKHGSAHYQIGKSYPYMSTREPGAKDLLETLKNKFDPYNLMNRGALEFNAQ